MPSLAIARAANASYAFSNIPIAIFLGGTSGVGQGTALAFARHTQGNAHIIICGRNRAAAEATIASFPKPTSAEAKHEFVECDAALMRNVDATTTALRARLRKVNYLVVSPGIMTFSGRNETEEGIDRKLALHYYARWKFVHDLLPLLQTTKDAGEDAKAMSILAPGDGGNIDLDDLGLRKNFSIPNAAMSAVTYNDLMIESFAERAPGVSFVHTHPGVVRTNLLHSVVKLLFYLFMTSPEDAGESLLYGLLHAEAGAQRRSSRGEDLEKKRYYGTEDARTRLWEHTVEEIERAVGTKA